MRKEEELKCLLQRPPPTATGDDSSESLSNGRTPPTPHATQLHPQHQQSHHLRYHNSHHAHPSSPRVFLPPPTAGPGGIPPLVPPSDSPPVSAPFGSNGGVGVVDSSDYYSSSAKEHPPKSPVRLSGSARVHLGDHGHTVVQTKKGITAREALARPMKLRKLAPETCAFYRVSDPQKVGICSQNGLVLQILITNIKGDPSVRGRVTQPRKNLGKILKPISVLNSQKPLPWDMDVSVLDGDEIKVEVSEKFPVTTSISHNFVRKTFFSLAFCECCRKLLFTVKNYFHLNVRCSTMLFNSIKGILLPNMRVQVPSALCG